jgi:hypothetical protein
MHNPLRSEAEMFRLVMIIGAGCAAVIALALIAAPVYGAILLAAEVGVGIGLLWRGSRGTLPRRAEIARGGDGTYRVLVLANQTVAGRALLEEIQNRCRGRRSEILVLVPALTSSRLEYLASDVDSALAEARKRLEQSLATMNRVGLSARGEVGDHNDPNAALEDALREFPADEVIISTHPPERSRWLERGVVQRARRDVPLPISHVVVDLDAERSARRDSDAAQTEVSRP